MITWNLKSQSADGLISEFELREFRVSWAGKYPPGQGIALGGEDGRALLIDKAGNGDLRATELDEAVNGLAFLNNWMGVSTRDEVRFIDMLGKEFFSVPYGGHGITTGPDGNFVSPLGTTGLLFFKPVQGESSTYPISRPRKRELDYYRVISLNGPNGEAVLACAARREGIVAMAFDAPERLHALTFEALDAIDLCQIENSSLAVAALGKDGAIVICRDVLEDTKKRHRPFAIRFPQFKGTAYRILSAGEILVVFTSQATFFVKGLMAYALQGNGASVTILEQPIKAIDANVIQENKLIVVTSRGFVTLDLRKLNWQEHSQNGHAYRLAEPSALSPVWQGRDVDQLVEA
jgi:hypothetical protein